jgi:nucleoside-diphosphate-sugar epimerase
MRVCVTGAAGGVGGYVVRELAGAGMTVTGLDVREGEPLDGVTWVTVDILDLDGLTSTLEGHDAVIHLAGIPIYKPDANLDIGRVNVLGAQAVMEACVRARIPRVAQASSICATAFIFWDSRRVPQYFPIDEEYADFPNDMYGLSKLFDEQLGRAYAERYGLEVTSYRMATVWVPDSPITEQELSVLLTEEMDGDLEFLDLRWQYVDVRDVAQAFRLAVEADSGLGICNVGAPDTPGGDWRVWVRDIYPDVPLLKTPQRLLDDPSQPLWSIDRLAELTGYAPEHTWREYSTFVAAWAAYQERREQTATAIAGR